MGISWIYASQINEWSWFNINGGRVVHARDLSNSEILHGSDPSREIRLLVHGYELLSSVVKSVCNNGVHRHHYP